MSLLLLVLLVLQAASGPATRPIDLPGEREFSRLLLERLSAYPKDGTHPFFWPRDEAPAGWAGNARELRYGGELLSPALPDGSCYCCGLTFELFLEAWQEWCRRRQAAGRIGTLDLAGVRRLRSHWFGANGDLACAAGAIPAWGLGRAIPPEAARPGDFVQFWRHSGSGHAAVFLAWERDEAGRPYALLYWSTQKATAGIGIHRELVGPPSGIDGSRVHVARVGRPAPAAR